MSANLRTAASCACFIFCWITLVVHLIIGKPLYAAEYPISSQLVHQNFDLSGSSLSGQLLTVCSSVDLGLTGLRLQLALAWPTLWQFRH
ncbi:hypothetical protein M0802_012695 [Mischocyttarus mexicanus]|nr:hypothetical protein M0802_012695 [Mischocyttarus mexicanus]